MYKTEQNLQAAFSEESQAYIRYTLFAAKADIDGLPEAARLFRAVAEAEFVHARNHFQVMGGIGKTKDNLLAAATCEHLEMTRIYPPFIEQANTERNDRAAVSFNFAFKAERVHNSYFEKALEAAKSGQPVPHETYFVCGSCGNITVKEAPPKCQICGAASDKFKSCE